MKKYSLKLIDLGTVVKKDPDIHFAHGGLAMKRTSENDRSQKVVPKQIAAVTNNSFRRQWISLGVSLRNENSTFSPLVTADGKQ
ncbi:hypothetical protein Celaphus_00019356 [Cervus elaphus hippelaphus]|uniref:Uncharacterized protein n=1 Tax=Cervus elaphus hippelaphus TaxID=46360 RepID=A0A212C2Z9_CEREH|nr:hypothetical protein Celaphus_00019356 [Cervus elaphus hippelaphus]